MGHAGCSSTELGVLTSTVERRSFMCGIHGFLFIFMYVCLFGWFVRRVSLTTGFLSCSLFVIVRSAAYETIEIPVVRCHGF
jgi:hypothetical protein